MKKQVKLTESELYKVIRESVKSLVTELGGTPSTRTAMAQAAKRAIKKGDDSVYHNAVNSITKGGGSKNDLGDFGKKFEIEDGTNLEEFTDFDKQKTFGPDYDEDFDDDFNEQPTNDLAANEGRMAFKVNEAQLKAIIRESVERILQEEYTGDEPFVPNKYPGEMPNFHSKEEYRNWRNKEAPNDWFDWKDDRKFQRTGIQPGQSGLATRAMRDRRNGKMSWNNDKAYNKFQTLKRQNGIQ